MQAPVVNPLTLADDAVAPDAEGGHDGRAHDSAHAGDGAAAALSGEQLHQLRGGAALDAGGAARPARYGVKRALAVAGGTLAVVGVMVVLIVVLTDSRKAASAASQVPARFSAHLSIVPQPHIPLTRQPYSNMFMGPVHKTTDADGNWVVSAQISFNSTVDVPEMVRTALGGAIDRNVSRTTTTTLTVLGSRAYFEVTADATGDRIAAGCVPESAVPPIDDIQAALEEAVGVPNDASIASWAVGSCATEDDRRWSVPWGGQFFVMCALEQSRVHEFIGSEFIARISSVDLSAAESPPFAAPVDAATGETIACPVIDLSLEGTDFDVPTTARRLGSDAHVDAHPDYDTPRRVALDAPVWYMKSHEGEESHAHRREHEKRLLQVSGTSSKTCLFVHGGAGDQRRLATSTYDDYWGEVHQYVNDACEPKFLHLPMRDSAWDSPSLAIDFCDDAAGGHTGQAITDTLVFAHGAGSNVVISALAQGRCTLDASSALVNVAATNYGAQMAVSSFANDVCRKRGNHALKAIFQEWMIMRGLCSSTHRSQMAESLDPTYTGIDISFDQLQQYGQEVMSEHPFPQSCTEDAWGLTTEWSGIMSAFDDLMRIETSGGQTDGMMQPSQCASTWAPDSGSRSRRRAQATRVMAQRRERRERRLGPGFFDFTGNTVHLQVNNVDGTCMAGDSMFDMLHNRSPCKLYGQAADCFSMDIC